MDLCAKILEAYPDLPISGEDNIFGIRGKITLQDDGDGVQYIARWDYEKPIPKGLKLGK